MAKHHAKGMTEERRRRAARALEMRRDFVPYRDIADALGVSVRTAYEDVQKALKEITREPAEDVLKMELERLGAMHLRLSSEIARVTKQLKQNRDDVDLRAVEQVRRLINSQVNVSERRARLLGLNAAQRVELANNDVDLDATVAKIIEAASLDPAADDGDGEHDGMAP